MSQPLTAIAGAYLYQEYQEDPDLAAWWASRNGLTQGYLNWWNGTPLALYTSPNVSGALLDWIGNGIYGIARPVISQSSTQYTAGLNSLALNSDALNGNKYRTSGTATVASDDIYRRVMTWWLWRGDGRYMNVTWIKRRVMRFLTGANGSDMMAGAVPPSVQVSGNNLTINIPPQALAVTLQQLLADGYLLLPFPYTASVTISSQSQVRAKSAGFGAAISMTT